MVFPVRAYPPIWRVIAASLLFVSRAAALVLLFALLFFDTPIQNPLRLMRVFAVVCLAPEVAAWLIARVFSATLRVGTQALVVESARRRIEIPRDIIAGIEPWPLPIPDRGFWLRLHSGGRFEYGLETRVAPADFQALLDEGDRHPADDLAKTERRWWRHPLFQFGVVALVPAGALFRLHQWITFGGAFGEYYQFGLQAYLLAFAVFWANAAIWLVLYATALRAIAWICTILGARTAPSYALRNGPLAEPTLDVFYYGGIALFLARLFLLSRV